MGDLLLVDPFVRDMMPPCLAFALFGAVLSGPWRAGLWRTFFRKAFPTHRPDDFAGKEARRDAKLAETGRFAAFRRMAVASKIESQRRIADVSAPVLVLMGSRDSDFSDPAKEARHVADLLHGVVVMIEGAGHYPQTEMPDAVAARVVPFMQSVDATSGELGRAS
jgi:pimeloyl-ACP methyl ester carboxylesterase